MVKKWGGRESTNHRNAIALTLPQPCTKCGRWVRATDSWDVDHIVARVEGGSTWDPKNMGPAHSSCNRRAGAELTNARRSNTTKRIRSWLGFLSQRVVDEPRDPHFSTVLSEGGQS